MEPSGGVMCLMICDDSTLRVRARKEEKKKKKKNLINDKKGRANGFCLVAVLTLFGV